MKELRTHLPESTALRETAQNLDCAIRVSGLSNEAVGDAIGCAESYVRAMRTGTKPLPSHKELQLPSAVALPFAAAQAASRERLHSPLTAGNVEAQAAVLGAAASALSEEIFRSLGNDGKIDAAELLKIVARHVAVDRAEFALRVVSGGSR